MHLHAIQHVEFEGPGPLAEWAEERGHVLTSSMAPSGEFPACGSVDFLVILGGPMDADDETASPWLHAEKHFVADCITSGRVVLGICLGAQIIAEVLGGKITRNAEKEIGWYPITKGEFAADTRLFDVWPDALVAGHWHADTFSLPTGLRPVFSSEACRNQAFVFDHRVVGLQFHAEWTPQALADLVAACPDDLESPGRWIMSAEEIQGEAPKNVEADRRLFFSLLDRMVAVGPASVRGLTP
jgi:GMP synthase-like glutamine amidotransferase